jgi:excisionase family DNA binding protein
MIENYVGGTEASAILRVQPVTVKRYIRDGNLPAKKFGNKWILERDQLLAFAGSYDGRVGRVRKL